MVKHFHWLAAALAFSAAGLVFFPTGFWLNSSSEEAPGNNFPTVYLQAQDTARAYYVGDTFRFEALADDCDGTVRRVYFADSAQGILQQKSSYPFDFEYIATDTLWHSFYAIAVDDFGDSGISPMVKVRAFDFSSVAARPVYPTDSVVWVRTWGNAAPDSTFPSIKEAVDYLATFTWTDSVTVNLLGQTYLENQMIVLDGAAIASQKHLLRIVGGHHPFRISQQYKNGYSRWQATGGSAVLRVAMDNVIIDSVEFSGAGGPKNQGLVEWADNSCNLGLRHSAFAEGGTGLATSGTGQQGGFFYQMESHGLSGLTFNIGSSKNVGALAATSFAQRQEADYEHRQIVIDGLRVYPAANGPYHGGVSAYMTRGLRVSRMEIETRQIPLWVYGCREVEVKTVWVKAYGQNLAGGGGLEIKNSDSLNVAHCFLNSGNQSGAHNYFYFKDCQDIDFMHNTGLPNNPNDRLVKMENVARVNFRGNLLPGDLRPSSVEFATADSANWHSDYNVFAARGKYNAALELYNIPLGGGAAGNLKVTGLGGDNNFPLERDFQKYRQHCGQDGHSKFVFPSGNLVTLDSTVLQATSVGRNMVWEMFVEDSLELGGRKRTLPTDAGATDADAVPGARDAFCNTIFLCESCLPPAYQNPQPQNHPVAAVISRADIHSTIDIVRGHATNARGEAMDVKSMIDTSDVLFKTGGQIHKLKTKDPLRTWNVKFEEMRQGWKNPVNGIIEWKYPVGMDSIMVWTGSNVPGPDNWFRFWASNDMVNWVPLTGKLNWTFFRHFVNEAVSDTSKYHFFKAERGTIDINGHSGGLVTNGPLKIVLYGRRDSAKAFPAYLEKEQLPISHRTFGDAAGVNAYYFDSLQHVEQFNGVAQFVNYTWHFTGPGQPFAIAPSWMRSYTTIYKNGTKFSGPDGLPNQMLRAGMPQVYKHWQRNGVGFIFQRFQQNSDAYLLDSIQQYYVTSNWSDTATLTSTQFLVTDTLYSFPDHIRGEPQVFADTIQLPPHNLPHYDHRKMLWEAWDSIYYPTSHTHRSDWFAHSVYLDVDSARNIRPGAFKSIRSAMRMPPQALALLANPAKRDSVMSAPETYVEFGEFCFNYAAIHGRNPNIPKSDLRVLDTSLVEMGMGTVQAMSGENEADKSWYAGLANHPAQALGMMRSVMYDGHMGLVTDQRGGHRVGLHTADPSMIMAFESTINSDLQRSIEAQYWCEYFRRRDSSQTNGTHPYSGQPIEVRLKNCAWDLHEYRTSNGSQGGKAVYGSAVAPETHASTEEMMEGLRIVRSKWPDYEVYCSEYGYGNAPGGRFSARKEDLGIYNAATGQYERDTTYDLLDAQASNNDWDSMFRHRFLDRFFIYELVDRDKYYAHIDTTTQPYSVDRDSAWNFQYLPWGFPSHGLRAHFNYGGAEARLATVPKPAWYSMMTLTDVIGNSIQEDYVVDWQDSVAIFKYRDTANNYLTYAVRRFSQNNGTTANYSIDIPSEATKITRIEPVRNEPALKTENLGDLEVYVTDVREKYFLLKIEL